MVCGIGGIGYIGGIGGICPTCYYKYITTSYMHCIITVSLTVRMNQRLQAGAVAAEGGGGDRLLRCV